MPAYAHLMSHYVANIFVPPGVRWPLNHWHFLWHFFVLRRRAYAWHAGWLRWWCSKIILNNSFKLFFSVLAFVLSFKHGVNCISANNYRNAINKYSKIYRSSSVLYLLPFRHITITWDPGKQTSVKFESKYKMCHAWKPIWKCPKP